MKQTGKQQSMNDGKKYWLSPRDRDGDPEYRELMKHEFPEGTIELASTMKRRTFMTLMGASMALAGLTSCRRPEENIVPYVSKPEEVIPGNPRKFATSMPLGVENYSLVVDSREGRPVKAAGNAMNTFDGAASNVWANASVLNLYDPDRSRNVRNGGSSSCIADFETQWLGKYAVYLENGGEGLALLSTSFSSPTLRRLVDEFKTTFPKATVVGYEPVCDRNIVTGSVLAFDAPLKPVYDFKRADVVLSLDADFLGTESRSSGYARDFASRRRLESESDGMNRLYLVESTLTQTSNMTDHRLRIQSRRIAAFTAALAKELQSKGLELPAGLVPDAGANDFDRSWLSAVADDLLRHKGTSVILAGRAQPAEVHALIAALNEALGNNGRTVEYKSIPYALGSNPDQLASLAEHMKAGKIGTLLIAGGNPAYNAPRGLGFADGMEKVETTVHLSPYVDETSSRTTWHLPRQHYLEQWGDAASLDGHLGVVQPLIAPLYEETISDVEFLSLITTGVRGKGYDIVRKTWESFTGSSAKAWKKVLHDGLLEQTFAPAATKFNPGSVAAALSAFDFPSQATSIDEMEIVYRLSPAVHDGRFANNGWLQEFPDPVSKLTWDNAAMMSAKTAAQLGVEDGSLVQLNVSGQSATLPVWILPGQADYSVTVTLGYGRDNGRIAKDVGTSVYTIRGAAAPYFSGGLKVTPTSGTHKMACVQDHHGLDVEDMARQGEQERLPQIIREATLEEYRDNPDFVKDRAEQVPLRNLWDDHDYSKGHQWGMSIDLNGCTGCGSCTIACQSENNIPIVGKEQVLNGREMHWIRIDRYYSGDEDNPETRVQPVGCQHCEMAPCEQVCPVAATTHDDEGLNVMAYNRCIGTRYCSNNCPYKVRRFNFFNYTNELPETTQMAQNPDVTVRFRGVMEKCTYCTQRIERVRISSKLEGRDIADGDIVTACEEACPTGAIVFGDINDKTSRVATLKQESHDYALLGEFNLRPRTSYLGRITNPNPALTATTASHHG